MCLEAGYKELGKEIICVENVRATYGLDSMCFYHVNHDNTFDKGTIYYQDAWNVDRM